MGNIGYIFGYGMALAFFVGVLIGYGVGKHESK